MAKVGEKFDTQIHAFYVYKNKATLRKKFTKTCGNNIAASAAQNKFQQYPLFPIKNIKKLAVHRFKIR